MSDVIGHTIASFDCSRGILTNADITSWEDSAFAHVYGHSTTKSDSDFYDDGETYARADIGSNWAEGQTNSILVQSETSEIGSAGLYSGGYASVYRTMSITAIDEGIVEFSIPFYTLMELETNAVGDTSEAECSLSLSFYNSGGDGQDMSNAYTDASTNGNNFSIENTGLLRAKLFFTAGESGQILLSALSESDVYKAA